MSNPNDNKSYREVRQESYSDRTGNTHTNVTRATETVNNSRVNSHSYESGYLHGRVSERDYQEQNLAQRDNNNAVGGFLIGLLLTALAGLTVGAVWYFNQRDQSVDNIIVTPSEAPAATQSPQPQTTIIEKTREVPIPIPLPQQNASPASTPSSPNINITVPPQEPAARETAPTLPQSSGTDSNSSTSTTAPTNSQSDSSTATPSQDLIPKSNSSTTDNSNTDSSAQ